MSEQSTNTVPGHRIPRQVLESVFFGPVDRTVIETLRNGQRSRRLLRLKVLQDLMVPAGENNSVDESWTILADAERRDPDVVQEILAYPSIGAWLVRVIRKVRGIIDDDVPIWVDLGYLNSIAAAAAIRTGVQVVVEVPVLQGRVNLPTVGQFEIPGEVGTHMARLRVAESAAFLESRENTWVPLDEFPSFPLREHHSTMAGKSVRWTIDDIDPYRTFDAPEAARRLDAEEFDDWCGRLDEAWAILVAEHPDHVPEVTATGPVIVPIPPRGSLVASSSAASFGAICLTPPDSPGALAETVVHELQHSKLNAVLDLVTLHESTSNRLCYAPWRHDPRPLSGLLHGIYAFTGVVEYWRRQWLANPDVQAAFMFAHYREQVRAALVWLGAAPELTELGARFLEITAERLAACADVTVPHDILTAVSVLGAETRLAWRLRHMAPPDDHVADLARRWLAGEPVARLAESELRPDHCPHAPSGLQALITMRVVEPARFADLPTPAEPGELELARGDHAAAVASFANRLRVNVDDDTAWAGMLAAARADELPPETVAAVYHRIRAVGGAPPDPVSFVDWFAGR